MTFYEYEGEYGVSPLWVYIRGPMAPCFGLRRDLPQGMSDGHEDERG